MWVARKPGHAAAGAEVEEGRDADGCVDGVGRAGAVPVGDPEATARRSRRSATRSSLVTALSMACVSLRGGDLELNPKCSGRCGAASPDLVRCGCLECTYACPRADRHSLAEWFPRSTSTMEDSKMLILILSPLLSRKLNLHSPTVLSPPNQNLLYQFLKTLGLQTSMWHRLQHR